ncbi:hypothetical protein EXIGLDRAFT_721235 [Exidia glandulosa HHB12029]|uniref:Uncharacterized protein n=1 Tax=Exidia glandulosa HHB12029 TaxID=1314781 RepID=A0A165FUA4_EXIGL|nr:hypothetical protein EXIGLDRAFT_721235 [Exidia glandulosa HHB12029]
MDVPSAGLFPRCCEASALQPSSPVPSHLSSSLLWVVLAYSPFAGAPSMETIDTCFDPDVQQEDQLLAVVGVDKRVITDQTIRECRILATVQAVRFGRLTRKEDAPGCMLVFVFRFAPFQTRFRNASIDIIFEPIDDDDDDDSGLPVIEALGPERIVGDVGETYVRTSLEGAFSLGATFGQISTTPLQLTARRETERLVSDSLKIVGTGLHTQRARFTLEENATARSGIPDAFIATVILNYGRPFRMRFIIKASVAHDAVVRYVLAKWTSRVEVHTMLVKNQKDMGELPAALHVDSSFLRLT